MALHILVNVIQDYFEKVQQTALQYSTDRECMWTMDQSSFAFGRVCKTRVIGQTGSGPSNQLEQGDCNAMLLISAGACHLVSYSRVRS